MNGRMYAAAFQNVPANNGTSYDIWELNAPSTGSVIFHSLHIGQDSDAGDAEAEQWRITIQRSTGTSGSGGASITPAPLLLGHSAFGGTAERMNTTQATTLTLLKSFGFNVQAGLWYQPTPEERIVIRPSGRIVVRLESDPADAVQVSSTIVFESLS